MARIAIARSRTGHRTPSRRHPWPALLAAGSLALCVLGVTGGGALAWPARPVPPQPPHRPRSRSHSPGRRAPSTTPGSRSPSPPPPWPSSPAARRWWSATGRARSTPSTSPAPGSPPRRWPGGRPSSGPPSHPRRRPNRCPPAPTTRSSWARATRPSPHRVATTASGRTGRPCGTARSPTPGPTHSPPSGCRPPSASAPWTARAPTWWPARSTRRSTPCRRRTGSTLARLAVLHLRQRLLHGRPRRPLRHRADRDRRGRRPDGRVRQRPELHTGRPRAHPHPRAAT